MQSLSPLTGTSVAVVLLIGLSAVVATQSTARPQAPTVDADSITHYGDNRSLWSRDRDRANQSVLRNQTTSSRALAATTDIPFNRPPEAVAEWNREQLAQYPQSGANESVYPASVTVSDGTYVRDAYVEIFTVQPSTVARLGPYRQPRYVAPDGELFATLDYRVAVPEGRRTDFDRVSWSLTDHEVSTVRLLVDGREAATDGGSQTPRLDYDLGDHAGTNHTLTVEANVTVTLERTHSWCTNRTDDGDCAQRASRTRTVTERVTVTDSRSVTEHRLDLYGFYGRYPNGDLGLAIFKSDPWLGYELPGGRIDGVWRFYSARDPAWDTMVTATGSGTTRSHSPIHPLQVSAFASKTGPTAAPPETVSIREVNGRTNDPPTLPSTVNLDVVDKPYTASFNQITRFETPNQTVEDVTARGLVRGVATDADPRLFTEVPIHRSNLTLTVLNETADTATVRITLTDATAGEPIETADIEGFVRLAGERVQTGPDGTVTKTVTRPPGTITASFEPAPWWLRTTGYVGDADTVSVQGPVLSAVRAVFRAGVPIGLFLLAVFLIDRITGMPVWPPWRGL